MTLTQLNYMSAVAEHGNFTVAADKCFVTQPTLHASSKVRGGAWG